MNDTNIPAKSELGYPQALLYIPSIVVAIALIVFLGVSFVRYHFRVRNKMEYMRDYVEKNLHVKRERIPGHVVSLNRPRIAYDTGNVFMMDHSTLPEHALPEHSITVENEKSIYLKKPRTPKSYFDNEGYEEDIGSNILSRARNFQRPFHEHCNDMEENYVGNESDNESQTFTQKSRERVRILSNGSESGGVEIPVTYLCETCQNHVKSKQPRRLISNDKEVFPDTEDKDRHLPRGEEDDDAFQRSPKPSTHRPPTFHEEKPKPRKKSLNSRTFPDAKARLGVFELEQR